jgi:hypothetical protein
MKALKHYGLISKKTRWGLTIWGWLAIVTACGLILWLFMGHVYNFLAPTRREPAPVLVLEGAVPDYVLVEATKEFSAYPYQWLITTGTPLEWGHLLTPYGNTANIAAFSLKKMGFDSTRLIAVSTDEILNDRTFNSALELGEYLHKFHPEIRSVNLMSYSVHSRRSQMLFQYALGDSIRVGIIASGSFYYGSGNWWKSGKGFREVMNEVFAYIFTRFFFKPYTKETIHPKVSG